MSFRSVLLSLFALLIAGSTAAQVTVGRMYANGGGFNANIPTPPTSLIDTLHPATGAGNLTHAIVHWANGPATPCQNAFKLKFVRPGTPATTFSSVIERGPFSAVNGRNDILLNPVVAVVPGDLIGITQLVAASGCGAVTLTIVPNQTAGMAGNVDVAVGASPMAFSTVVPAIFASADPTDVVTVLPVAGALQGSNGSFFRTSMQITNTDIGPNSGTIVYHPAGAVASPSDPSKPFSVGPEQTISFPDIAASLGQSGLGSIDIVTTGQPVEVSARIFNDLGDSGTLGFTEEGIHPLDALTTGQFGRLRIPSDVTNYRMNVGIRTLNPTTLRITQYTASGASAGTATKTYPANYFEQTTAQTFLNVASLTPDGSFDVFVFSGRAIVYATVTDNRTNDSSMAIATAGR